MVSAKGAAARGVVAALVGVAVGDLTAAVTNPGSAPVIAVATQVIDLTPTRVKEWAIAQFGTADKAVLIAGVATVVVAASAMAGWLARRRQGWGLTVFVALGTLAGAAALVRRGASALDVVPAVVTVLGAGATLAVLMRSPSSAPRAGGYSRRRLLGLLLSLAVAGATESLARHILDRRTTPDRIALPRPRKRLPPLPTGLDVPGITPFRTSRRDFYRVDTRLTLPTVDVDAWRLRVDGRVVRPVSLTFDDLASMDVIERDIALTCVSNEVGGRYVGAARWLGIRLTDVLAVVGGASGADQILSTDVDGMTISTPLDIATDGRDSMIAIGMNGAPLPREHGFPARLIVPGLYGFVGATKWITRMTLTTYAEQDAYWTKRGWAIDAPIKPSSRIDTPRPFQSVRPGEEITIGGIAWAQDSGGVRRVEVSIDDGPWRSATVGPSAGAEYWRQWYLTWVATPGRHSIAARAVCADGSIQSANRATPFPDGSSGIQRLSLTVS